MMLQQIIPDLWPHDLPQYGTVAAVQPISAGSEASAESAVPETGEQSNLLEAVLSVSAQQGTPRASCHDGCVPFACRK